MRDEDEWLGHLFVIRDPDRTAHRAIQLNAPSVGAAVLRRYLGQLGEELVCAHELGLDVNSAYIDDLAGELALARDAYMLAVVRDTAVLRGALAARPQG